MKALIWIGLIWVALVVGVRLAHCEIGGLSDFDSRLIHFNDVWGKFYRKHFNCPPDATKLHECRVDSNRTSYDGFPTVIKEFTKEFIQ